MLKALLVTILLTHSGELVQLPQVVELDTMGECIELARQRSFQPPPAEGLASFTYCEIGETA